jgi:predicted NUDIX family phosphoesterase
MSRAPVLVLPRAACPPLPEAAAWAWTGLAGWPAPAWLSREQAEQDEAWLQLIPYALLCNPAGQTWCYARAGGDARLTGRMSCGVGGHVEPADAGADLLDTLGRALRRELTEELGADAGGLDAGAPRAWLYEHRSAIGRVHLGVVYRLRWPLERDPAPADPALRDLGFRPLAEIARDPGFELWSRLAAAHLAGIDAPA